MANDKLTTSVCI